MCALAVAMPGEEAEGVTPVDVTGSVSSLPAGNNIPAPTADIAYLVDASTAAVSISIAGDSKAINNTISLYVIGSNNVTITYDDKTNQANVTIYAASGTADALKYYAGLAITLTGDTTGIATINNTTNASNASLKVSTELTVANTGYGISVNTTTGTIYYAEGSNVNVTLNTTTTIVNVLKGTATVKYVDTSTATNEAKIVNNGTTAATASVTGDALQVGGSVSGTGASLTMVSGQATINNLAINQSILSAISSVTFYGGNATTGIIYAQIPNAPTGDLFVYKQGTTGDVTLQNGKNIYVRGNGTYSGAVSWTVNNTTVGKMTVMAGADSAITAGSEATENKITITGSPVTAADIVIGSNVTVTGMTADIVVKGTVALGTMTLGNGISLDDTTASTLVLSEGDTLTFDEGGSITLDNANDSLYVLGTLAARSGAEDDPISWTAGTIYAVDPSKVAPYTNLAEANITAISTSDLRVQVNAVDAAATLPILPTGTKVELVGAGTVNLTGAVTLNKLDILITTGAVTINIGTDTTTGAGTVILQGVTIAYNDDAEGSSIVVNTGSSLSIVDSLLFIVVDTQEGSSVTIDNDGVEYTNTSSNVSVGYGTTLTLTGDVKSIVDVYGDLIIAKTATIPQGTTMTVYKGGSVTVNGTMTVMGTAVFSEGSEGTVNGTMTVGGSTLQTSGAILDVNGDFTISENATVTITGVGSDNRVTNKLEAPVEGYTDAGYDYKFTVIGTLNMNGALSGYIHNQGTVTINGFAVDTNVQHATVVIYDGIEMTVTSVSGSLDISDAGISDDLIVDADMMKTSDGNKVTLGNVKNVTVSEKVNVLYYTDSNRNTHRDYQSVMSLAGDVTSGGNGLITIAQNATTAVGEDDVKGYVTVPEGSELNFGANVSMTVDAGLVVDGSIEYIYTAITNPKNIMGGNGPLTVNGTVTVTTGYMQVAVINAAKYTVTTTGINASSVETYTNFVDAVNAAPEADNDLVTVYGSIVAGTVDIPAGVTVNMTNGAEITVAEDATVVLKNGAIFNGGSTNSIEVAGTFTAENRDADLYLNDSYIHSDVIIVNAPAKTWTSFSNALGMGLETIVLNRDIVIDEDTIIPDGTTVTTVYSVSIIDEAVLSINGTLAMTPGNGKLLSVEEGSDIEVAGVLSVKYLVANNNASAGVMTSIDGVYFIVQDAAYATAYLSNMEFAAETASANSQKLVTLGTDGNVQVIGSVGAGDVTFTAAENYSIRIFMNSDAEGNILTMGTMTMAGNVSLTVSNKAQFTGSVSAPFGADGTAEVSFDEAGQFMVSAGHNISVDGNDYYVAIAGSVTGGITVNAGTVEVASGYTLTVTEGASVDIASGATLYVAGTLAIDDMDSDLEIVPLTVSGTLAIDGAIVMADGAVSSMIIVSGTIVMDNRNAALPAKLTVYVPGTLQVGEGDTLTLNGKLVIGTPANSLGAAGSVTGDVNISTDKYIIAYAGADLSGAKINWNAALDKSDTKTTTYYVNGMEYATVYAIGTVSIDTPFGLEKIDITGYYSSNTWYASPEDAATTGSSDVNAQPVGRYGAVYTELNIKSITGVVSKDAGIILTIDGLVVVPDAGYGDQSFKTSFPLSIGTHTVAWSERSGYTFADVTVTFNGVEIENGATITITPDMESFTLIVSGSEPSVAATGGDDGLGLTDYLLIILVVLIVVMAIMVALRLMRS